MKRMILLLFIVTLLFTLYACTGQIPSNLQKAEVSLKPSQTINPAVSAALSTPEATKTPVRSKAVNVFSFTEEVPNVIRSFVDSHPDFGFTINTLQPGADDSLYRDVLDGALTAGGSDAPDIYCVESAFVTRYTQGDMSGYAMPYRDLGIDVDSGIAAADIANYIVSVGTRPSDNEVVGLGYQSTEGAFIYRRSIAKKVWGTDDPAVISSKIGPGWDKFFGAAAELKAKGFGIVSGENDILLPVEQSADKGWIVDNKLYIDPKREAFLDYSKELIDKGYTNDTQDWTDAWYKDMAGKGESKIFGFFGPSWLINYVMIGDSGAKFDKNGKLAKKGGTYGDWAICQPTVRFFWGGTWVLANKALENDPEKKAAVAELIDWMTLDCTTDGLQYKWANGSLGFLHGTKDTVASGTVMKMCHGKLGFLGGQDMFGVFMQASQNISGGNITDKDDAILNIWRKHVYQYAHGDCTLDEAISEFKKEVKDQLKIDAW